MILPWKLGELAADLETFHRRHKHSCVSIKSKLREYKGSWNPSYVAYVFSSKIFSTIQQRRQCCCWVPGGLNSVAVGQQTKIPVRIHKMLECVEYSLKSWSQRGQRSRWGRPRFCSLSSVQQRFRIANQTKVLHLLGAQDFQAASKVQRWWNQQKKFM